MKPVNIAELKSKLSKYLGFVRHGQEVVIFDRKEPVARMVPFAKSELSVLNIEESSLDPSLLFSLEAKPAPSQETNSIQVLLMERGQR